MFNVKQAHITSNFIPKKDICSPCDYCELIYSMKTMKSIRENDNAESESDPEPIKDALLINIEASTK